MQHPHALQLVPPLLKPLHAQLAAPDLRVGLVWLEGMHCVFSASGNRALLHAPAAANLHKCIVQQRPMASLAAAHRIWTGQHHWPLIDTDIAGTQAAVLNGAITGSVR